MIPKGNATRPVTQEEFRALLGGLASGVTVVTAVDGNGRVAGMTATAVTALSLQPPLLLVCVNHEDPLCEVMSEGEAFAVNLLASGQEALSRQFAGPAEARFKDVARARGPNGLPLLSEAAGTVICEPWTAFPVGDHTIFVGCVVGGSAFAGKPLLYHQGSYSTTTDVE